MHTSPGRILSLALLFALGAGASGATAAPAKLELTLDSTFTGKCRLDGPGGAVDSGTAQAATLTLLNRRSLPAAGWYWGWGLQAENYSFGGGPALPKRLQDYAGIFSLEYFQGNESAAALTFRPGWYFADRPVAAAWDVPVDLAVGVPLTGPVSGVVGFSNARFYHHAVPVAGVVWTINPRVRLELVYPEPALVIACGATTTLRLGGTLAGAGFLTDAQPTRTAVEFVSYRAGAEFNAEVRPHLGLIFSSGIELERSFDFFSQGRRLHGSGARYASIGIRFSR